MKRNVGLALLCAAVLGSIQGFSLTTNPSSTTVNKGSKLTLTCVADEAATYTWYKQSTIPTMVMTELYNSNNNVITVDSASEDHAGFYQCKAVNGDMTIYSNVASVNVYTHTEIELTQTTVKIDSAAEAVRTGLDCDVSGTFNPQYSIEWYKDGELVSDSNAFVVHGSAEIKVDSIPDLVVKKNTLVLFNIDTRMAGTYECKVKATLTDGVVTQTAYEYKVDISRRFGSIEYASTTLALNGDKVTEGQTATLCCGTIGYASGSPVPTYTWYKSDGSEVTEGLSDSSRTLKTTTAGSYTCKACVGEGNCLSNVATASMSQAESPVQFTQEPTSYYLYEDGETEGALSLTCKTSNGDGNWIKNGKAVTFPIDSPKSSDSGVYQCFAYNSDSWISKTTEVIVTEALSLTLSVPSEIDDDSTDNTVVCKASGYPTPTVMLYKQNYFEEDESIETCYDESAATTGCIRKSDNTYSITIDKTNVESSGTYYCKATHSYQSKDGSNLNQNEVAHGALAVIKAVQVESFTTSSNALEFGDMAEFTCKVSGGRAPYKVEMKRGDLVILTWSSNINSGDNKGDGTCTGAYEKTCKGKVSVVYGHEGTVTCTGYNTVKDDKTMTDSSTMELTVTRETFVEITGDFFPIRGDAITLTCVQNEKPLKFDKTAAVAWYKDGEAVTPDSQTATEIPTQYKGIVEAVFEGANADHEGKYKCTSAGVTSPEVDVYVDTGEAPYNVKMTIPDGIVGEEMEMKCEARGYPPPSLTWTIYTDKTVQNTTTIDKEKFKSESVITWTPFEGGTFDVKCTATNGNGTVTETSQMTIITEAEAEEIRLKDSEVAAVVAASIIAGIIVFICFVFICICVCKNYREKKHDGDASALEKGDNTFEQTCLSCIACCPCCFGETESTKSPETPDDKKWSFPSLPKFNMSFIGLGDKDKDEAAYPPKKKLSEKPTVKITRLSQRNKMEDSPTSKKRTVAGRGRSSPVEKKRSPIIFRNKSATAAAAESPDGSPKSQRSLRDRIPSFKRSKSDTAADKPSERIKSKDAGKGKKGKDDKEQRPSISDVPISMRLTNFFSIPNSPFVKYDSETGMYNRTMSMPRNEKV